MRHEKRGRTLENQNELLKRQISQYRERCDMLEGGTKELSSAADAVIIGLAKRYGEKREENGKLLGYRLPTEKVDVAATLRRWEIFVEDQGDERIIGVSPREAEDGR